MSPSGYNLVTDFFSLGGLESQKVDEEDDILFIPTLFHPHLVILTPNPVPNPQDYTKRCLFLEQELRESLVVPRLAAAVCAFHAIPAPGIYTTE